jgi:hypothetical protein
MDRHLLEIEQRLVDAGGNVRIGARRSRTPSTSPVFTAATKSSTGVLVRPSILCLSFAQLAKP